MYNPAVVEGAERMDGVVDEEGEERYMAAPKSHLCQLVCASLYWYLST